MGKSSINWSFDGRISYTWADFPLPGYLENPWSTHVKILILQCYWVFLGSWEMGPAIPPGVNYAILLCQVNGKPIFRLQSMPCPFLYPCQRHRRRWTSSWRPTMTCVWAIWVCRRPTCVSRYRIDMKRASEWCVFWHETHTKQFGGISVGARHFSM